MLSNNSQGDTKLEEFSSFVELKRLTELEKFVEMLLKERVLLY